MNIKEELLHNHSKHVTLAITEYIGNNRLRFNKLLDLFFSEDPLLSQRAAWPLSYVGIDHPELILPATGRLLKKLGEKEAHPAIARNILRIFEKSDVPEKYQATLLDLCFRIIPSELQTPAVRAFAITTACRICKQDPDLAHELRLVLDEMNELPQSPAIRVRIKLALKELAVRNSKH